MNVTQTNNAQTNLTPTNKPETVSKGKLGKNDFLKLLVTQMKNQDPINPMDSKEFASQLAQFNSVEQLIGVNKSLSTLQNSQKMMRTEMTNSMASSLAGKQVSALSNKIKIKAGGSAGINYELNNPADKVQIVIKDAESGAEVRTETFDRVPAGKNKWGWNGKNDNGVSVPQGQYKVEINAKNGDKSVNSRMLVKGTANRVRFSGNGVMVSVDGVEVPIGNIETVAMPTQ